MEQPLVMGVDFVSVPTHDLSGWAWSTIPRATRSPAPTATR